MKKTRLIAVALIMAMLLCLAGCGKDSGSELDKTALTPDGFMDIMVGQGYNIYDITAQLTGYDDIKTVYVATTGEELYQIEFYELTDFETAYALYVGNQMMFEELVTADSVTSHIELANFAKYTLNNGSQYMVASLVGSTMVYVSADAAFQSDIDTALEALGY